MRRVPPLLLLVPALFAFASFAPAQETPRRDLTAQLLDEVRQLRLALERQGSVGARVQLVSNRLALQDERVFKLGQELDNVRREILAVERQVRELGERTGQMEELPVEMDPGQRREMEHARKMFKTELATQTNHLETLRLREQELQNTLAIEQGRLEEISRRLDDLERSLEPR